MRSHNVIPGVSFAFVIAAIGTTAVIVAVMARLMMFSAYPVHDPHVPPGGCLTIQEHLIYCHDPNIRPPG
jgi:hypothetical protein